MAYRDFQEQEHPRPGHFATSHLQELVGRYTERLIQRVRKQLPDRLRPRVDPEDVVQSVFRNLFRRLKDEPRAFEDSERVWRLLTVLTYHKVRALIKYHQRARRDVRKERPQAEGRVCSDREPGPEETASLEDLLDHFLRDLPQPQRQMVTLRLEGADLSDIARRCDCSRSTVRRVLTKVQDLVRKELDAGG
jgi:RNA polymerase sigma factor (sigma-70 family)